MDKLNPAYIALVAKSEEKQWPVAFKTDLTKHDYNRLHAPDAPETFYWRLRESGTDLLVKETDVRFLMTNGQRDDWYFWDGKTLKPYTCNH
jgi:hypothetical protein